jgi:hypothetical protein
MLETIETDNEPSGLQLAPTRRPVAYNLDPYLTPSAALGSHRPDMTAQRLAMRASEQANTTARNRGAVVLGGFVGAVLGALGVPVLVCIGAGCALAALIIACVHVI